MRWETGGGRHRRCGQLKRLADRENSGGQDRAFFKETEARGAFLYDRNRLEKHDCANVPRPAESRNEIGKKVAYVDKVTAIEPKKRTQSINTRMKARRSVDAENFSTSFSSDNKF